MSIEIWQFPQKASRNDLIKILDQYKFIKGDNPFWPGPKGSIHYFWSEPVDYKSTSGVDASVIPLDEKAKEAWETNNDWGVRTRTSIWASSFDKEQQNRVVRTIRKNFGGTFYNDHFGKNRYIKIEKIESTPASRGIYSLLGRLEGELSKLENALPNEMFKTVMSPLGEITEENDTNGILAITKQFDPSRVIYNALIPFLVSILEHFFRETFEILIKYDSKSRQIIESQNKKVTFQEAIAIEQGDLTLERVVSNWYSFQNVDSIQKAYKEILGIDVWKILRRRKKIRDKLPNLMDALQHLIGARHGVVHHFSIDYELNKEKFLILLHLVGSILEIFCDEIERNLNVKLSAG